MAFQIEFTQSAADHIRAFRTYDQRIVLDAIEEQLRDQPTVETRNRKPLSPNELSNWELRVEEFRIFYDVIASEETHVVKIKAVGRKEHNKLKIGDSEVQL